MKPALPSGPALYRRASSFVLGTLIPSRLLRHPDVGMTGGLTGGIAAVWRRVFYCCLLALGGTLCLCETPEGLRGFQNVTGASVDTVLSCKGVKFQCRVSCPFNSMSFLQISMIRSELWIQQILNASLLALCILKFFSHELAAWILIRPSSFYSAA